MIQAAGDSFATEMTDVSIPLPFSIDRYLAFEALVLSYSDRAGHDMMDSPVAVLSNINRHRIWKARRGRRAVVKLKG